MSTDWGSAANSVLCPRQASGWGKDNCLAAVKTEGIELCYSSPSIVKKQRKAFLARAQICTDNINHRAVFRGQLYSCNELTPQLHTPLFHTSDIIADLSTTWLFAWVLHKAKVCLSHIKFWSQTPPQSPHPHFSCTKSTFRHLTSKKNPDKYEACTITRWFA